MQCGRGGALQASDRADEDVIVRPIGEIAIGRQDHRPSSKNNERARIAASTGSEVSSKTPKETARITPSSFVAIFYQFMSILRSYTNV